MPAVPIRPSLAEGFRLFVVWWGGSLLLPSPEDRRLQGLPDARPPDSWHDDAPIEAPAFDEVLRRVPDLYVDTRDLGGSVPAAAWNQEVRDCVSRPSQDSLGDGCP